MGHDNKTVQPALFASEHSMITIYGQPDCHPCRLAQRQLDKEQVPYDYVDLTQHPHMRRQFHQQGLLSTPIIETPTERFTGLQPDRIKAAAQEVRHLIAEQQQRQRSIDVAEME